MKKQTHSLGASRDIDAAKERLATAKRWEASATKMAKCIEDLIGASGSETSAINDNNANNANSASDPSTPENQPENSVSAPVTPVTADAKMKLLQGESRRQLEAARNEVKDAESNLADVEERWEVIDLEDANVVSSSSSSFSTPPSQSTQSPSSQPTPLTPTTPVAPSASVAAVTSDDASNASNSSDDVIVIEDKPVVSTEQRKSNKRKHPAIVNVETDHNDSKIEAIVVKGCGLSAVKGLYRPCGTRDEAPQFIKEDLTIFREKTYRYMQGSESDKKWVIGRLRNGRGGTEVHYYHAPVTKFAEDTPPSRGWRAVQRDGTHYAGRGQNPFPRLGLYDRRTLKQFEPRVKQVIDAYKREMEEYMEEHGEIPIWIRYSIRPRFVNTIRSIYGSVSEELMDERDVNSSMDRVDEEIRKKHTP